MRTLPPSLTLVVPGLFGPYGGETPPRLPALEWLLARSDVEGLKAPSGLETTLFCLFEVQNGAEEPVGPVCRYGDGGAADESFWFRADPVHLTAHQDRIYLLESERLALVPAESDALIDGFNAHFAPDGLTLEAGRSGRFYLRTLQEPEIETVPTPRLKGCDLFPHLPRGRREGVWRAWLNEVQMLFHASRVNAEREARGEPTVSGLWIWGGGRLPKGATSRYQAVFSNECVAPGLARLATVGFDRLPDHCEALLQAAPGPGRLLAVNDLLRRATGIDGAGAVQVLAELERCWFAPAREALRAGRLAAVEIIPTDGRLFRIGRRAMRRFWRRPRRLTAGGTGRSQ